MVYVKRLKRIVIITFLLSLSVCILRIFGFHSNPGFIQQSLVLTPYLVLGYVVRNHPEWFRRKFLLLVYCLAVISVLLFKLDYPCMTMIIMLDACNILPFFLLSYSGCLLFLVLSKKINKNYIFEEIGKKSLYIYLVHITVMYACIKVLFLFGVRNLFFLMPFAVLSSICISYGIAMLINYTKSLCYDKRYSK